MSWAELREEFADLKPEPEQGWYKAKIRDLVLAGLKLADAEMEALYAELVGDEDADVIWYFEMRNSTYPSVHETEPHHGIYQYGTHDRSERVEEAIVRLGRLHAGQEAWVMPVYDTEEYVSWEFDVIVGSREEVLDILREAINSGLGAAPEGKSGRGWTD